jgi:hypothetical protein
MAVSVLFVAAALQASQWVAREETAASRGVATGGGATGRDGGILWCTSLGRAGLLFVRSKGRGIGQKAGGRGGSVQEEKSAMAAVLLVVRTAQGRQPGQQRLGRLAVGAKEEATAAAILHFCRWRARLGVDERGVLAAHMHEQEEWEGA